MFHQNELLLPFYKKLKCHFCFIKSVIFKRNKTFGNNTSEVRDMQFYKSKGNAKKTFGSKRDMQFYSRIKLFIKHNNYRVNNKNYKKKKLLIYLFEDILYINNAYSVLLMMTQNLFLCINLIQKLSLYILHIC